jgi:hypothetical protein
MSSSNHSGFRGSLACRVGVREQRRQQQENEAERRHGAPSRGPHAPSFSTAKKDTRGPASLNHRVVFGDDVRDPRCGGDNHHLSPTWALPR